MSKENRKMHSATSDIGEFNKLARKLERSEVRRGETNLTQARKNIAQRIGITIGQIENYRSARNKAVPYGIMEKFRAALISALQLEMKNLAHEIELNRRIDSRHSENTLASAEGHLLAMRELLAGEVKC